MTARVLTLVGRAAATVDLAAIRRRVAWRIRGRLAQAWDWATLTSHGQRMCLWVAIVNLVAVWVIAAWTLVLAGGGAGG